MKCNCRWKNCKRHGKCDECREHHKNHAKHPIPYCEKKKVTKKGNGNESGCGNQCDTLKHKDDSNE